MKNTLAQHVWNFIGIPFRYALFDQSWLPYFRWTTLEEERIETVLPYVKGRLLDIGAGYNNLVRRYGNGIGVDIIPWVEDLEVVADTSNLPFEKYSFDTITFVACLNHIPNRLDVLKEAKRLLRPDGKLIITMINPFVGTIGHAIWWYSEDKKRGGMKEGELGGLWTKDIKSMLQQAGFRLVLHKKFQLGLNNAYIFTHLD